MKILVVGATGATGKLLVEELLARGLHVKAIVRSVSRLPKNIKENANFAVTEANILEFNEQEMAELVRDCAAVASCLGHNLSFKGIFGHPRRLVTDATRRLCTAIQSNHSEQRTKFVLMNTTGVRNRDRNEQISVAQRFVIGLLRLCLPPHADNEDAADFLRSKIGQNDKFVEWVAVRPDGLIDQNFVSDYELHPSPTRSAIFDSGKTSRINVGHFIADLITRPEVWLQWKGQMPVIYNKEEQDASLSAEKPGE